MSIEAYPLVIPGPIFDSNAMDPVDPVSRTKFDSGAMKTRRRFTKTPVSLKVKYRFKVDQFRIFEAWHKHKISEGADKFTTFLMRPAGSMLHVVQFKKMYKAIKTDSGWYDVNAELLIYDLSIDSEAWLDAQLS